MTIADRVASENLEKGGEEDYSDRLNPKSETRSTKPIQMTKIPMTETRGGTPLTIKINVIRY